MLAHAYTTAIKTIKTITFSFYTKNYNNSYKCIKIARVSLGIIQREFSYYITMKLKTHKHDYTKKLNQA